MSHSSSRADQAPSRADLALAHPVYQLLDRLEARGIFEGLLPRIRPYSISAILALTGEALASTEISETESQRLLLHRNALSHQNPTCKAVLGDGSFYQHADSVLSVTVNPLFSQSVEAARNQSDPDETISQTRVGLGISGTFHRHFSFRLQHYEGREWSTIERRSRSDVRFAPLEAAQIKGQTADFRESRYQVGITLPWFEVDFGKESFDWGPARDGNLFLQHRGPSFLYGRLRFSHKALTFEHILGALRTPPDDIDHATTTTDNEHRRTLPAPKRLVTHRLELAISDRLTVGIHEAVIYGDRGFETAYAIPVSILVGAQSYAGDTDNLAIGFDVSYGLGRDTLIYGSLFFDDLAKFSPGAFSNQIGVQAGVFWVNPLGLKDVDIRAEYARLEPYTYAHNFSINSFTHFDANLGHPIGPNADRASLHVQTWLTGSIKSWTSLARSRQGENYEINGELVNVGGDPTLGRRPTDKATRTFLSGDRITRDQFELGFEWEASSVIRLLVQGHYHRTHSRSAATGQISRSISRSLNLAVELNAF
jgi:hypothetical protein